MPHESRSSPREIQNYLARISGPLLDRIDLHVEVPAVRFVDMIRASPGEPSEVVRARVLNARNRQLERFKERAIGCNARMTSRDLRDFVTLDESTRELLKHAMTSLNLSARAHDRILKVSRTIADLNENDEITMDDLGEAIRYRSLDRSIWR
jgi:magnesium chelatase family protein